MDHYYAVMPNADAYKVDWCTYIPESDTAARVPAPSDRDNGIIFGCMDTLEKCIENVDRYQKIHNTHYECIVYKRKSENEPYAFVKDYVIESHN